MHGRVIFLSKYKVILPILMIRSCWTWMDRENLPRILEIASDILNDWSLSMNESKTAFTRVFLAGVTEVTKRSEVMKNGGTLYFL